MVAEAAEVADKPIAVRFFGEDLVLYRGQSGAVYMVDAYCPHMGTPIAGAVNQTARWDDSYRPKPIDGTFADHPGLAGRGRASMHADSFQSDVHPYAGPMGPAYRIKTRKAGGKMASMCPTYLFPKNGKLVMMCGALLGFDLKLLDPESLEMLARYRLPMRPSAFQAMINRDPSISFSDSSGGAYLFLDKKDRIVFADARQIIQRIEIIEDENGEFSFRQERSWNMRDHVPNDCRHYNNWFPRGECDMITTVMPDYGGLYWWVTRFGRVGTLDPETGRVATHRLDGEEIQNAVAVDASGVYILSDHAMYAFAADGAGVPQVKWRESYDRGSGRKIGSINQGSGTTPTILGDDYITFADNADPQINLIVLRRGDLGLSDVRRVCSVPVFEPGKSATDNSIIAIGRSILIENNHGFTNGFTHDDYGAITGGVARIDIREDLTGCDIVWTSDLVVPSVVPKLSSANGIAYFYSFDPTDDGDQLWSLVGLDFETGKEIVRIPTGVGDGFNNNWASIAIAPDGETTYVGSMGGTIQIRTKDR